MTRKFLIELKDKLHIVTAEKIERVGEELNFKLLKPRDDDVFSLETEDYRDFWLWLKDEKSFLSDETLDICFLYPGEISPKLLMNTIDCIGINVSEQTEITVGDVKLFLKMTGRNFSDAKLFDDKTVLLLEGGSELLAVSAREKGLNADPKIQSQDTNKLSQPATKKFIRQRPKAFKAMPTPTEEKTSPIVTMPDEKKELSPVQSVAHHPPHADNTIPKANATDIQIGIKQITEYQCQEVDFRD